MNLLQINIWLIVNSSDSTSRPRLFVVNLLPKHMPFCLRWRRCRRYDWWVNKTALAEAQARAMIIGDDVLLRKMWWEIGRVNATINSIGNRDDGRRRNITINGVEDGHGREEGGGDSTKQVHNIICGIDLLTNYPFLLLLILLPSINYAMCCRNDNNYQMLAELSTKCWDLVFWMSLYSRANIIIDHNLWWIGNMNQ
jgi:hypothetical protein